MQGVCRYSTVYASTNFTGHLIYGKQLGIVMYKYLKLKKVCMTKLIASIHKYVPSLSMIVTVDDEAPSINDKQLGKNLIAILNVSLSSCVESSVMLILIGKFIAPAGIVRLNNEAVT